jgi:hypothetical protein
MVLSSQVAPFPSEKTRSSLKSICLQEPHEMIGSVGPRSQERIIWSSETSLDLIIFIAVGKLASQLQFRIADLPNRSLSALFKSSRRR